MRLTPTCTIIYFADNGIMERCFCHTFGKVKNFLLSGVLFLCVVSRVLAAPLERGYDAAPAASASTEAKDAAYWEARYKVLAAAGKYEKTPYRYGGTDRNGMDCSGLVYTSFKEALSVTIPRSAAGLYTWVETISADKLQPGDLVFFKTDRSGNVTHVGIYAGDNRFIHSASAGPQTGVMYSALDERYWAQTFCGAGRAFPGLGSYTPQTSANQNTKGAEGGKQSTKPIASSDDSHKNDNHKKSHFMMGVAVAPTWNAFLSDGKIIRGFAGHVRLGAETFAIPMIFGLELRPEWDGALGVFRLPLTLSWGINDKFRVFAGPVLSIGDPILKTTDGDRYYSNGTTWFGAVGITAAPFAIKIFTGELAPYGEIAWQSYFSDNNPKNTGADFAAGLRLSTGLRYTWRLQADD